MTTDPQALEALKNREYAFILDRSGSMNSHSDTPSNQTRWQYQRETARNLATKLNEFDPHGLTVYLFSTSSTRQTGVTAEQVDALFDKYEPSGGTNLAGVLQEATSDYFTRKAKGHTKPGGEEIFVLTDGAPDDPQAVIRTIVEATKKLTSENELNFTFVQVGHDESATKFLARLDDDLGKEGAKYDIVDTISIEALGNKNLTEAILDSVFEHKQHA